ncbi:MAG: biosynthetic-type acetolactate synthase large subunit [Lachnospiraceae bacterium]|nr:biosynthetic-type acetolactate synthase large subunit [Lachnospiraceae bacterium]
MPELTGSQIVIECLKEQGVDTVFGYPGGAILNIYDELYKHPEIHHILTSHEQGAAHAADGYARATGKVGVCMATSGPGATNLVTGIATAYMDSVPIVAITANVGTKFLGKDSFQEVDITGITMPITKYSMIVKDVSKLADALRKAFRIAKTGRPGPVLVDIPKDVTAAKTSYHREQPESIKPAVDRIRDEDIEKALHLINSAKKPYIFVGGGAAISGAQDEIIRLAHMLQAPVCDTLMGKGTYPGTDPAYMGMLGMHGTKGANLMLGKCDLLIVLGARFSDRDAGSPKNFARQAKILQIDIDPAEVNKNVVVSASVTGDLKIILDRMLPQIQAKSNPAWTEEMKQMQALVSDDIPTDRLSGQMIVKTIYDVTKGDALITTEVGQHQMWTAQYYKFTRPRALLTSGGLGTMGYGLGAAIGAKSGCPDKTVINIAGDGCFRMNMNELATASRNGIAVIEVIIDNSVLGMVRQWQTLFYGKRYSQTVLNDKVDYVKVSEGLGVDAVRVTKPEEFRPALEKALASGKPYVIDCVIDPDDKVSPIIPAGKPNDDIYDQKDMSNWKG